MTEHPAAPLLAALQHADSMFPSGMVSFSWGLEALCNRGIVSDRGQVAQFLTAQIAGRWATFDRVFLVHALRAGGDLTRIAGLDALVEAQSLAAELRRGSRQMGLAMLGAHRRLDTPLAGELFRMVRAGETPGHAAVVQGVLWGQLGFSAGQAQVIAAHGLCAGLLGAAIRLSIISHIEAQKIRAEAADLVGTILGQPVCAPEEAHGFTPQIEIASMNHETDEMRLFIN